MIIQCNKLIIALGGNPNFDIFKNLKIQTPTYKPSLCALKTTQNKRLNNIRVSSVIVSCLDNNINFKQKGEVLFKEDSITGIVIFNLSSHLARINNYSNNIFIDLLPDISLENLTNKLINRKNLLKDLTCENFLTGFFHKALNLNLLEKINCPLSKLVSTLSNTDIKNLAFLIKNFKVKTLSPLDNNQVFSGGINIKSLDENFMFKSIPNLYAIGEILDIDAECGGFNLQWAWTSAYICAKNI